MDITSNYIAENHDLLGFSRSQRARVRDWHCLNPYLYSGTVTLGLGRPDIRVGMRMKIPGESPKADETFYVESVSHSWSLAQGVRTSLGVTRGWIGDDPSYLKTLSAQVARYNIPDPAVAGSEGDAVLETPQQGRFPRREVEIG